LDESLFSILDVILDKENLDKLSYQVEKIFQLRGNIKSRHGNVIIGGCKSGKSTLLDVLQKAQNQLGEET
jgi:hypothetical protein